ncbi:hypothetical protein FPOA_13284 [Fusarium poae]|uniref:Uncharacterized protein n=1 Tax=Fusarium poae TaxID=36050 RepID=A0A1B8A677_FUSPO|nr:hypothetical protein FPOA_13284 [Fusarium poae]
MITARFVLLQTQRAIWEERIQKAPYCPPPPRSHKEEKALVDVQNAFNKGGRLARFSTYLDKRVLWSGIQGALPSTKAPLMLKRLPGFRFLALRGLLRRTAGRTVRSSCGEIVSGLGCSSCQGSIARSYE